MTTSIHNATPLQLSARMEHKKRLARIADRAIDKPVPPPPVEPEPAAEPPPQSYKTWFAVEGPVTVEEIKLAVADAYGMSKLDLASARRTGDIVRPRQVAMYLAKTLTQRSLSYIGHRFGDRDHSTVHHAIEKIGQLIQTDPDLAAKVAAIKGSINA